MIFGKTFPKPHILEKMAPHMRNEAQLLAIEAGVDLPDGSNVSTQE